jgi:hypothetical protein
MRTLVIAASATSPAPPSGPGGLRGVLGVTSDDRLKERIMERAIDGGR